MICMCCYHEPTEYYTQSEEATRSTIYCPDCADLIQEVNRAVYVARRIGVPRYGPSSWRDVSIQEHLEHASKHIYQARKQIPKSTNNSNRLIIDDDEDHLAHAICRLVMAKVLTDDS